MRFTPRRATIEIGVFVKCGIDSFLSHFIANRLQAPKKPLPVSWRSRGSGTAQCEAMHAILLQVALSTLLHPLENRQKRIRFSGDVPLASIYLADQDGRSG